MKTILKLVYLQAYKSGTNNINLRASTLFKVISILRFKFGFKIHHSRGREMMVAFWIILYIDTLIQLNVMTFYIDEPFFFIFYWSKSLEFASFLRLKLGNIEFFLCTFISSRPHAKYFQFCEILKLLFLKQLMKMLQL